MFVNPLIADFGPFKWDCRLPERPRKREAVRVPRCLRRGVVFRLRWAGEGRHLAGDSPPGKGRLGSAGGVYDQVNGSFSLPDGVVTRLHFFFHAAGFVRAKSRFEAETVMDSAESLGREAPRVYAIRWVLTLKA